MRKHSGSVPETPTIANQVPVTITGRLRSFTKETTLRHAHLPLGDETMMRLIVRTTFLLVSLLGSTTLAVHADLSRAADPYQLGSNPKGRAFVFGQTPGFSPAGSFQITIYNNGTVKLDDLGMRPSGVPLRLRNPKLTLSPQTLQGLMTLARAERFLDLPDEIAGKPIPDLPTHFLTLHTATTSKSVALKWTGNARFQELYGVLAALTVRCFKPQTGKQVCFNS
jgi:hypothetical protein